MAFRWSVGFHEGVWDHTRWFRPEDFLFTIRGVVPIDGEWVIYNGSQFHWYTKRAPALYSEERYPTRESAMAACILIYGG